jgi:hypothetical protein
LAFAAIAATPSPSPALPPDLYLGGASTPAITASQASRILTNWWPLHERALASNDIATTDAMEAGAAREYDDAVSRDNMARGGNLRIVREFTDFRVLVPWQDHLPAFFLAEVATTIYGTTDEYPKGTPYTEILLFTRTSKDSPWMASLRTGHTNLVFDEIKWFKRDNETYDMQAPKPAWISPAEVPGRLADYWSYCYQHGAPAHQPFVQGYWTTELCPRLQSERLQELGLGISTSGNYYVDLKRDGFWELNVYGGWDFACFTVRVDRQLTPAYGLLLQDGSRNNYGGLLEPGQYSLIKTSILHQSCALIPPTAEGTPQVPGIGIVGGDGGIVAVTGVRTTGSAQATPGWLPQRTVLVLLGLYASLVVAALIAAGVALNHHLASRR